MDNSGSTTETPTNQPISPQLVISSKSNKTGKILQIFGILLLIAIFSAGAYYLGAKGNKKPTIVNNEQSNAPTSSPSSSMSTPTSVPTQASLFSGKLKRTNQNLKIFNSTVSEKLGNSSINFVYYEAGVYTRGDLKDYTRIIAIRPSEGPGLPMIYVLATKDYQSYILDDPDNKTTRYPLDDWKNPYTYLDKSKISSVKTFESEQPKELVLNQNYALYSEVLLTEKLQTNEKDINGNPMEDTVLTTEFSSFQKLSSPIPNITIYFKPYKQDNAYIDQLTAAAKEKLKLQGKYILGETEVIVVDSVGLPISYALTTPDNIKNYNINSAQYEIEFKNFEDQLKKYNNKEIPQYPEAPEQVFLPTLGFNSSQIVNQNNLKFYKEYQTVIPGGCAVTHNTKIVNIADTDVEQIGTVFNLPLYRLKDKNNQLYSYAYENKLDFYTQTPSAWDELNKGMKKPNLDDYIAQNPLLFVKDYWNRWVALGEFDIKLPGGCGKPVVYLYPSKPTDVTVQFQVPIQFTTNIPTYSDFWKVLAYPNGSLVNLKPELTSCQNINSKQFGSEYAGEACRTNTYPYLYWEGNVIGRNYPSVSQGWIVEKNQLHNFFENKLTEIGLNENEKSEFMNYWIQELLSKNAPYYRLSFLQTQDLNSLFPMNVKPKPDTMFRVFLDYSALVEKPNNLPQPQVLNKLIRKGFTLVEWGGIKK